MFEIIQLATRRLAKECGGRKGKPAIPAFTKFERKEKGHWIRLRADGTFMGHNDEGYYEIRWLKQAYSVGKWFILDPWGELCHENPNDNPEDMNATGKNGRGGWKVNMGVAPAPELIKVLTASEVRCYAKPVNPKP